MNRDKLVEIINDTIEKCENEYSWMLEGAENIYYDENHFKIEKIKSFPKRANIQLVKQTTVEALQNSSKIVIYTVLNFASAKHPGGGVLKGTVAQEEALARASSLYPVIKNCTEFYGAVQAPYYTDKIIYSTPIYIFKNDYGQEIEPIECEVITCAAPNYSFCDVDIEKHKKIMTTRFTKVLKSAIANNQRNIMLGAWGCGVFQNPPDVNAQIFRKVLDEYSEYFDDIIFAIPDNTNYEIFKENLY